MVKLLGKIGIGLSKETSQEKITARTNLFTKYIAQNKIIGDFFLVDDNTIQINFIDLTSAQDFVKEIETLYAQYTDDFVNVEYI